MAHLCSNRSDDEAVNPQAAQLLIRDIPSFFIRVPIFQ
jgi:hypothetical protein